ncbi:MAG: hypothetical protein ABI668_15720 [Sphingorhabdus sp.]
MAYDLLISDATFIDGTGEEPYRGDVAVIDGVIAEIGLHDGAATPSATPVTSAGTIAA